MFIASTASLLQVHHWRVSNEHKGTDKLLRGIDSKSDMRGTARIHITFNATSYIFFDVTNI